MIRALLLILVFLPHIGVFSQFTPTNGPYGGIPYSTASDGTNLYAGTYGGVLKSSNDGVTWSNVSTGLTQGTIVSALYVFNTKLFAGTDEGIYISDDEGISWYPSNNGYTGVNSSMNIHTIYAMGNRLFLGTTTGVFISSDQGVSWQPSNLGMPITQVYEYRAMNSYLFAATDIGVFKSEDQGSTWYSVNNGLTNTTVFSITAMNNVVFAGTQQGAFKSTDFGATWTSITTGMGINGAAVPVVAIGNYLYMGTGVLYRSSDYGTTWVNINSGLNGTAHALIKHSDKIVCAGISMYLSSNNGQTWNNIGLGYSNYVYDMLMFNNKLLCATANGIYSTSDYGDTWLFDPTNQLSNSNIIAIEQNNGFLFVSLNDGGIYKSVDGGLNWSLSGLPQTKVNVLRSINGKLYAGTTVQGLYTSVDNGLTWVNLTNGLPTYYSVIDITHSSQVIAIGTTEGVYISANNGVSWISASVGYSGTANSICYNEVSNMFFTASTDIYKSINSASSWELSYYIGPYIQGIGSLKSIGNNTFAGTYSSSNRVFKTIDGINWQPINPAIFAQGISDFEHQNEVLYVSVVDPHPSGRLNGVWRASNGILNTEESFLETLKIYPNPVNQIITIEANECMLGQNISIKNSVGVKILDFTLHESKNQIDVSNLPSGVYFVGLVDYSGIKQNCFLKN